MCIPAKLKLPVFPSPMPSALWRTQVCSLRLWLCFSFVDREFDISRCIILYIEWKNNKVLLYSTGKYIQSPVTNNNGKEYEKEYIYTHTHTYIYSLCCTAEINTTLWINYTSIYNKKKDWPWPSNHELCDFWEVNSGFWASVSSP